MLKYDSIFILSSHGFYGLARICFLGSLYALGIGAASFASHAGTGTGIGNWEGDSGTGRASKDIAESPTASPERPPF